MDTPGQTVRVVVAFAALALSGLALVARVDAGRAPLPVPTSTAVAVEAELGAAPELAARGHVGAAGGTILVDEHGLLVLERDPGELIRADRDGEPLARLELSPDPGQIVHDGHGQVFVADRQAHRVVRVEPGDASGAGLAESGSIPIREPYGLALTPDGATLLVTNVADHELVAIDTASFEPRWRLDLAPEPRAVTVSPDGSLAAVGFLTSASVAVIELARLDGPDKAQVRRHAVHWRTLSPSDHLHVDVETRGDKSTDDSFDKKYGAMDRRRAEVSLIEARSRFRVPVETGRRHARNVAALTFVGSELVAGYQLATPQIERIPDARSRDSYGGGVADVRPLRQQLSALHRPGMLDATLVHLAVNPPHQPRALAYDPQADILYVGGYGDDQLLAVAKIAAGEPSSTFMPGINDPRRCGIDGIAVDDRRLWIHCGLARRVIVIEHERETGEAPSWGPQLAPSGRSEPAQRGAELFSRPGGGDQRFSLDLACASCHPEGRADGLSWRLGDDILQAPILAGRVTGTAPYKWDGRDPTLVASFRHTIERIGGRSDRFGDAELEALAAYVQSLPAPMSPSEDPELAPARARGRELFVDNCEACHAGPLLTDASQYPFATRLAQVDTPSLLGLAQSAPYFHDGSAQDLWALVTDKGSVHDMVDTSALSEAELRDLVAYLEGL